MTGADHAALQIATSPDLHRANLAHSRDGEASRVEQDQYVAAESSSGTSRGVEDSMTDTAAIESLRAFAVQHGELQFGHLCTAALAGEEWAVDRLVSSDAYSGMLEVMGMHPDLAAPIVRRNGVLHDRVREVDTARPDGAIARGMVAP